jgi:hypothetical protein
MRKGPIGAVVALTAICGVSVTSSAFAHSDSPAKDTIPSACGATAIGLSNGGCLQQVTDYAGYPEAAFIYQGQTLASFRLDDCSIRNAASAVTLSRASVGSKTLLFGVSGPTTAEVALTTNDGKTLTATTTKLAGVDRATFFVSVIDGSETLVDATELDAALSPVQKTEVPQCAAG